MCQAPTILFICLHGSAKSVIAAEHFRRIAAERGIVVETIAAGVEPDDAIPPHVVSGLAADGIDVHGLTPLPMNASLVESAGAVISFGCAVEAGPAAANRFPILRWDDVPPVSEDYGIARAAIVRRLDGLIEDFQDRGILPLAGPRLT